MRLAEIMSDFGANVSEYIMLSDAPRINNREYGFSDSLAVLPFCVPIYSGVKSNLAAFAAVPDYHKYAEIISESVMRYISHNYGEAYCRLFADVSPFDEVRLSAMCGLGIIGDNGLLITEKHSSFVMLGEIVTESDILRCEGIGLSDGSASFCEHCGECKRSCPSYGIDDKIKCISEITQKKSELTDEEILLIHSTNAVWGCDRCSLVCPHTIQAIKSGEIFTDVAYFSENNLGVVTSSQISEMSDEEYAKYPFSWRKRSVILRNLKINED